jgi:hypothetical protein
MLAHRLCLDDGILICGERRAAACRLSVQLSGNLEDKRDLSVAEAFREETPISASGHALVRLTRDVAGLLGVELNARGPARRGKGHAQKRGRALSREPKLALEVMVAIRALPSAKAACCSMCRAAGPTCRICAGWFSVATWR